MSDPVRITNPGAESLGYDSDGHEMALLQIVGGDKLIIPFC
ncbi:MULTISPECIES: hypothetical protein [Enterobacteriaceae]|nr:hypothetical protein [Escherichia coli]GIP82723.1 hypothetical protein pm083_38110 [Escherichia coli]SQO15461.1 colicin protein [Escherichia coli]SVF52353.1 colicin protein [Escherichia coli]SVF53877.1 colicin protein [Escherichia coli]